MNSLAHLVHDLVTSGASSRPAPDLSEPEQAALAELRSALQQPGRDQAGPRIRSSEDWLTPPPTSKLASPVLEASEDWLTPQPTPNLAHPVLEASEDWLAPPPAPNPV